MKVLLTFDDNYAPHAAVVIESILANTEHKVDFIIMYFQGRLSDIVKASFVEQISVERGSVEFRAVDSRLSRRFMKLNFSESLSINTFLRLLSPTILQEEELVLYLDCDLIVLGDIVELMTLASASKPISAVAEHYPSESIGVLRSKKCRTNSEEMALRQEEFQFDRKRSLGMSEDSAYFNAGVMILNLAVWRGKNIMADIFRFVEAHKVVHSGDQDILNAVFDGDFGMLPLNWNIHPYIRNLNALTSSYTTEELDSIVENPKIIHFAGYKAWEYMYPDDCYKDMYWRFRKKIPASFGNKRIETGFNSINMLRKKIINPMRDILRSKIGIQRISFIKSFFQNS